MFRALLKHSFYFARRVKKATPIQAAEEGEDVAPPSGPRGVRSELKQMKELFSQMDRQGGSQEEQNPSLDRTLQLLQKMIAEDKQNEEKEAKAKSKVSVEEKLRKLGTPEHIIQKRQSGISSEQVAPKFTMQELRNDGLVSQIMEQSGSSSEELENNTGRELKLAQQELMLQQIMKQSKQKEVKLDVEQTKDPEGEQDYERRLILRREKIIESLQQKQNPAEARLDWTTEDLLAIKYSPEILAKAREYNNKELMYFKELINDEELDNSHSRLNKRHYRDKRDEDKHLRELSKYEGVLEPVLENSYLSTRQEEGLKVFEDDQFYKNKAAVQLREQEALTAEDLRLRASLEQDLELGDKVSDVFLDEAVFPQEAKVERRLIYSETSFARQDQQIRELSKRLDKLGVDFNGEEVKALSKQLLFEEKHFLEVQQGFQKYLQRKEKKQNMKKELRQAHSSVLRDDLDYEREEEAVMSIKEVRQSSDNALLEDNFEKLREFEARKQAVLVQTTPEERQSEVHRKKTFKNMENFLALYFANGLLNHNAGQLADIDILQVVPNNCNTVMNIFWNISSEYLLKEGIVPGSNHYEQKFQKEKVKLESRLKNQANYISGKMTQLLRLRYGPEIRFHFDIKTKKTQEAIQELSKFTKEIAMVELEEYTSKGLIKNEEEQLEYYEKLLNVTKGKLHQFNSRKQLLSKKYQKFHKIQQPPAAPVKQEKTKNKRKNPVLEDSFQISQERKISPLANRKKKPSDRLWESIDLL